VAAELRERRQERPQASPLRPACPPAPGGDRFFTGEVWRRRLRGSGGLSWRRSQGVEDAVGCRTAGTARARSRPRVDGLREETDRIQAAEAEGGNTGCRHHSTRV